MKKNFKYIITCMLPIALLSTSCNKLLEVTPKYIYTTKQIYDNDLLADSVVLALYGKFATVQNDLSLNTGFSSDEFQPGINNFSEGLTFMYNYNLNPFSGSTNSYWETCYSVIGIANAMEEGVAQSTGMTQAGKNEVLGQAKFMRALNYYFLINLYGEVPLVLSSNYKEERIKPRMAIATIYDQIIKDLEDASQLLNAQYQGERVRANKWAAIALLSRMYLFTKEWEKAEQSASQVIAQQQLYRLGQFDSQDGTKAMDIFVKNNPEQILQLWNSLGSSIGGYTLSEFTSYAVTDDANGLLNAFESGDRRKDNYTNFQESTTSYIVYKYRTDGDNGMPNNEYTSLLRLSEQYLNRAEARLQLGQSTALDDINILRKRAGLTHISNNIPKQEALEAIIHERQVELCFEWADRWFTLKRLGIADAVMSKAKPGIWKSYAQLYPVPTTEIQNNRLLKQNPGYTN
ncbi:RagB/SusD family nutrient uptake outer membrane protein [Sphingobacterium kitahiroshimense]|uniref:RagB/SusD family nutrient uptake outer membrane protein n=1 Tax=Sphingobacterium sp. B16(2022) TaxID=2914044 RepID=UPI00143C2D41|nr:RagB/SusD family nutrient uptake outer membrane protein [Sphingobacterium sp. B16(2022)]NJI72341.1 RagB/SusD family nutrient uptake outer membrane protein [Sphingobacterium sp. B16(2022)]